MSSRWYNALVLALWLSTMSWLVAVKVLPPVLIGDPPNYRTIVGSSSDEIDEEELAWNIYWNRQLVGTALSRTLRTADEVTRLESELHLDGIPLEEAMPLGAGSLLKLLDYVPDTLALDAESSFEIDPLGRLIGFDSSLTLGSLCDPIQMRGDVAGSHLHLRLRSGSFEYTTQTFLSTDSLVSDAMSPQVRLPGLRLNQAWTVPVYNPFLPPNQPMQILHARVEQEDFVFWNGDVVATWLVVYRSDEGAGRAATKHSHGRVWVAHDGTVLIQELQVLNSWLRFVRVGNEEPTTSNHGVLGQPLDE